MGLKSQYQVRMKQAVKRKKKRMKIQKEGKNLTEYYYGKFYLKSKND